MRYFCTLFDSNYLFKGLVTLETLVRHCPDSRIFVLCLDKATETIITKLGPHNIVTISLSEIEDESLLRAKQDRSRAEYCWTLSSCLPLFVFENYREVDFITYIDADLMFYSSLDPIFDEYGDASIVVIEHRFIPQLQHLEVNGRFCVEWVGIRRDSEGMRCLKKWRDQCVDWCYYRLEDGKLGDQKYLDEWPDLYENLHILRHEGAGVAPWNYANYQIECMDDGMILINGKPLIFYHFHQFEITGAYEFDRVSSFYRQFSKEPECIYSSYERELIDVMNRVWKDYPGFRGGIKAAPVLGIRRFFQAKLPKPVNRMLRKIMKI